MVRLLVILTLAAGCGSGAELYPDGAPREDLSEDAVSAENEQSDSCETKALVAVVTYGLDGLNDARNLYLKQNGRRKSLCDVVQESGKKVAIFQFAGVFCLSCQEEAQYLKEALKKEGDILHAVVFTDFEEEYTEDDFEGFMTKYTTDSLRLHDDKAGLWRHFSIDPKRPIRPTYVVVSPKNEVIVLNREGGDFKEILPAAKSLITQ